MCADGDARTLLQTMSRRGTRVCALAPAGDPRRPDAVCRGWAAACDRRRARGIGRRCSGAPSASDVGEDLGRGGIAACLARRGGVLAGSASARAYGRWPSSSRGGEDVAILPSAGPERDAGGAGARPARPAMRHLAGVLCVRGGNVGRAGARGAAGGGGVRLRSCADRRRVARSGSPGGHALSPRPSGRGLWMISSSRCDHDGRCPSLVLQILTGSDAGRAFYAGSRGRTAEHCERRMAGSEPAARGLGPLMTAAGFVGRRGR